MSIEPNITPASARAREMASSPPRSVLRPIVDALPGVVSPDGVVQTTPFLAACALVLPVLEALGAAFAPARSDVRGNVDRLRKRADAHVALFDIALEEKAKGTHASNSGCCKGLLWLKRFLVRQSEPPAPSSRPTRTPPLAFRIEDRSDLSSRRRSLTARPPPLSFPHNAQEFTVALLTELTTPPRTKPVKDAASAAYARTLKPFHGFVSGAAFAVIMNFPPTRDKFVAALGGKNGGKTGDGDGDGDAAASRTYEEMREVVDGLSPILEKIHAFLVAEGLDDPTKV